MSHSRQKSDVGALFAPGRPPHYNKYLNNSVNEPHLVDLDHLSGTLNSVAETTSTVFCAVWMYTGRMERTWCCQTRRRVCRCAGPTGPLWFLVLPETKTTDFASPKKRSQLAPNSGANFTIHNNELCTECRKVHFRHFLIELLP